MDLGNFKPSTLASMYNDINDLLFDLKENIKKAIEQDNMESYNLYAKSFKEFEEIANNIFNALVSNCGLFDAMQYISSTEES